LVLVSDRFHLKPLLPLLSGDGRFYVLALSQNEVRLLLGARYHITTIDLEDVPESLAEALRFDDPEKQQQFHTATASSGTPGGRPAVFHGHGVSSDDKQSNLLRYFQQIDRGLQSLLPYDEPVPLVLAGVEYLLPIYHDANHYPYLMDQGVTGNPEEMSPAELHERAWAIVHPHFEQSRQEARARYEQLANTDQASGDIRTILPAAHYGRVDTLFVALGRQQWGRFDPDTNTIQLRAEPEPEDEDLLNTAAIQTMSNGGTVFAVEPDDMPDQLPLAAIFRYKSSPDTTGAYE
jgi:hypothetical protein